MNNIPQPIQFSSSVSQSLAYKQIKNNYNYIPRMLISRTSLLPFQLLRYKEGEQTQSGAYRQIELTTLRLIMVGSSNEYIDLLTGSSALDLSFYVYNYYEDGNYIDAIVYKGDTTIPQIPRGKYYIYAEDSEGNAWTSSYLISDTPSRQVSFQYRNSTSNNYVLSTTDFYWKMIFDIYVHDTGEYNTTEEQLFDQWGKQYIGYRRDDKIWTCEFLVDSCSYDALYYMSHYCDTLTITDEVGATDSIEVISFEKEAVGHSNHIKATLNFTKPTNQLLSVNTDTYSKYATKSGGGSITPVEDLLMSKDKKVKHKGKFIKRR